MAISEVRQFDTLALNAYKSEPAFRYGSVRQFNESLWSRVKRWFWNKMDELFGTDGKLTGLIIFFSFLAVGVIALVYYLTRVQPGSLFHKADRKSRVHADLFDEQLEPEDLNLKIAEAKNGSNHRMAVRYMTIRLFAELEQEGILKVLPSTTMEQYRHALAQSWISDEFNSLTRYFEFVWYGRYDLNPEQFERIENRFNVISAKLKKLT